MAIYDWTGGLASAFIVSKDKLKKIADDSFLDGVHDSHLEKIINSTPMYHTVSSFNEMFSCPGNTPRFSRSLYAFLGPGCKSIYDNETYKIDDVVIKTDTYNTSRIYVTVDEIAIGYYSKNENVSNLWSVYSPKLDEYVSSRIQLLISNSAAIASADALEYKNRVETQNNERRASEELLLKRFS